MAGSSVAEEAEELLKTTEIEVEAVMVVAVEVRETACQLEAAIGILAVGEAVGPTLVRTSEGQVAQE
jgi:hypothetical protein